jgi:tripartite-type tricarboxylate transporter receptor subunit TctC
MACALVALAPTGMAQKAPPITIFVGSSTGGLYDLTARLWSRHLGRFLDGEPNILVQNMPGAGGLSATNHLYNLAPQDGSALGVVSASAVLLALFGDPAARFDPRKFAWIGGRSQETAVCGFWYTSKAKSFEDLRRIETVVASTGPGARSYTHPIMFNALLGTKFRNVAGYPGGSEMSLAIERGEVEGECGWSWGAMKARTSNWLREGKLKVLLQAGYKKNPELPDVPFALDLAPSKDIRSVMEVLLTDTVLAWPLIGPPNMTEARAAELRTAFDAMMKDAELVKDAEKNQLEVDPIGGREMQDIVNRLFDLPPPLIAQAKSIFK